MPKESRFSTIWALASLALPCLACPLKPEALPPAHPVADLSIEAGHFVSGKRRFLPVTNFLTAGVPRKNETHTYLSEEQSDGDRARMRRVLRLAACNTIFIYTLNDGDYGSRTSPYAKSVIGGAFDGARLARWRSELTLLVEEGLQPFLWLFADDSPAVHQAPESELFRYIDEMVARFDDLPVAWVLGLEVDEYWSREKVDRLGAHLAQRTLRPVGLHQTGGRTDYMEADWVDFGAYQSLDNPGSDVPDWLWLYRDFLRAREQFGSRPLIAAEYSWRDGGDEARRRGLALGFAGADGLGNGAPPGLGALLGSLPSGLVRSVEAGRLWLRGPGGLTASADPDRLQIECQGCPVAP